MRLFSPYNLMIHSFVNVCKETAFTFLSLEYVSDVSDQPQYLLSMMVFHKEVKSPNTQCSFIMQRRRFLSIEHTETEIYYKS